VVHREQAFTDSCGLCDQTATVKCARCELPLCDTHKPPPDARCTDCEGDFYVKNAKIGRFRGAMMTLGVAASGVAATVGAFALAGWGTVVIAGTMSVAAAAFTANSVRAGSNSKRRRKKFLKQHEPKYEAAVEEKPTEP
jgi:hypothetical protein